MTRRTMFEARAVLAEIGLSESLALVGAPDYESYVYWLTTQPEIVIRRWAEARVAKSVAS